MSITCFKWHFTNDCLDRYFYLDSLKECCERIRNTYRCKDNDYVVVTVQERDEETNKLVKEVLISEQSSLSLLW